MKTRHFSLILMGAMLGLTLYISSCQKAQETIDTLDVNLAEDNALAADAFTDLSTIADQAYEGNDLSFKTASGFLIGGCATITKDTNSFPRLITIDFGPVNCLCADGKYRRGKIFISYTGPYKKPGTVINITTAAYFVNDNHIMGTRTVINQGLNADNHPYWTITVNGKIVKADSSKISFSSQRTRTMIAGFMTPHVWNDDIFLITGSASGVSAAGISYDADISVALRKEVPCPYFVSGIVEITRYNNGPKVFTLNYGNGNCDNKALLTGPNGYTKIITLH